MSLIITIVGVWLGTGYARLLDRRFGVNDARHWLLLAPVWAAYVVVLLTADTREPAPRAIQAFALATVLQAVLDLIRALRRRRRARRERVASEGNGQEPVTPQATSGQLRR